MASTLLTLENLLVVFPTLFGVLVPQNEIKIYTMLQQIYFIKLISKSK